MSYYSKPLSFLLAAICMATSLYATTRKVLFIGNSYTYTNNMPTMLQSFAAACGDTLVFDMSAPGGYTFQQHTTYAPTLSRITAQQWDIVVLQEQSQLPSFPPAQVATDVYPYAHWLDSAVHDNDTCTQTMFMMTWGRRNGDAMNCPGYPVVCTYAGMQSRLRDSYMQMAQDNHALLAPMGSAWKVIIDSFPAIDLYQADSSHPSVSGSYLQACVFYASIFHKQSLGCTYLGGLPAATAQILQRIADKVVLDSLSQWQQYGHYPYAAYTHTQPLANTIAFTNRSQEADSFAWSFGDGQYDTAASPSHAYTSAGVYTVTLTAKTECINETRKDTIHVGIPTGISPAATHPNPIFTTLAANGMVTFILPAGQVYNTLEVIDSKGQVVRKYAITGSTLTDNFAPGIYIYRAWSADRNVVFTAKLLVLP